MGLSKPLINELVCSRLSLCERIESYTWLIAYPNPYPQLIIVPL
jgi:hypothetical protein